MQEAAFLTPPSVFVILQLSHPSNLSAALAIRNLHTSGAWDRVLCAYNWELQPAKGTLSSLILSQGISLNLQIVSCQTYLLAQCESLTQEVTWTEDSQNAGSVSGGSTLLLSTTVI